MRTLSLRSLAFLLLAGLAAAAGSSGPVGPAITVAAVFDAGYVGSPADIAYADSSDSYLGVYADDLAGSVKAARINAATGEVAPPILLSSAGNEVADPRVCWNPGVKRFLVVFTGNWDGTSAILGVVLDAAGQPYGGAGHFLLGPAPGGNVNYNPDVASNGDNWLVAWVRGNATGGLDLEGRLVAGTAGNSAPAFVGPPFDLRTSDANETNPAIAGQAGGDYLLTWCVPVMDWISFYVYTTTYPVQGCTVSAAGAVGSEVHDYESDAGYPVQPAVAANDVQREFLVTWRQVLPSGTDSDVKACLADASGLPRGVAVDVNVDLAGDVFEEVAAAWNPAAGQYYLSWLSIESSGGVPVLAVRSARLGDDLSILETGALVASIRYGGCWYSSVAVAAGKDTQAIVQWPDENGWSNPSRLKAQLCDLGPSPFAPAILSAGQRLLDGTTALAPGGVVIQPGFIVEAAVADADPDRLEVEVREVGVSFTGTPTHTGAPAPEGQAPPPVTISSLQQGKQYHWQVRAIDAAKHQGSWTAFAGEPDDPGQADIEVRSNTPPAATGAAQFEASNGREIPAGGSFYDDNGVLFRVEAADADGDTMVLDVEVRPVGQSFTGVPSASSIPGPAGTLEVRVPLPGDRGYAWRYRLRDVALAESSWSDFGSASVDAADFRLMPLGSVNTAMGCGAAALPGTAGSWPPAVAIALLLGRRRRGV